MPYKKHHLKEKKNKLTEQFVGVLTFLRCTSGFIQSFFDSPMI